MTTDWDVQRTQGQCAETGRTIEENEEFFSVLFEQGESFRRADYCLEAWTGPPPDSFCHYKTRIPQRHKKKQLLVDNEMLRSFFERLADEGQPIRVQFRFVVALILMRKRLLKLEGSTAVDGVETWEMKFTDDHSMHQVVNPRLGDDEIQSVSGELNAILHSDMQDWQGAEDSDMDSAADSVGGEVRG